MNKLRLGWIQIGVPEIMTAKRDDGGIYLEWHSQNGQTIIELANPLIEFVDDDELAETKSAEDAEADRFLDDTDAMDEDLEDEDLTPGAGAQIASFERLDDPDTPEWLDESESTSQENDPFGLFPPDLQASLNTSGDTWTAEPDEATLAQWKEWDEVFDGTKDVPLSSLFDPPIRLPPVASLNDQQVATLFNTILKQLARHNVAFHMCEHYTPRLGYSLLVDEILRDYGTHPELPRIGYTMNFDTSEFCKECDDEFERRYAERQARRESDDPDPGPPDKNDDNPF
jgi:hypothetical protein